MRLLLPLSPQDPPMADPCTHAYDIANLIAVHDFPGMPDIYELEPDIREAYLDRAKEVLSLDPHKRGRHEAWWRDP